MSNLRKNESGATAIEYGLIAALIAIALITVINALAGDTEDTPAPTETEAPADG